LADLGFTPATIANETGESAHKVRDWQNGGKATATALAKLRALIAECEAEDG
jgi:hypothetical protein